MPLPKSDQNTTDAEGAAMAPELVFDTLLGAGIGIILAVACSTLDSIRLARHVHHKALAPHLPCPANFSIIVILAVPK